jgi:hypothetical protein
VYIKVFIYPTASISYYLCWDQSYMLFPFLKKIMIPAYHLHYAIRSQRKLVFFCNLDDPFLLKLYPMTSSSWIFLKDFEVFGKPLNTKSYPILGIENFLPIGWCTFIWRKSGAHCASHLPNPFGRPQFVLQTQNVWVAQL